MHNALTEENIGMWNVQKGEKQSHIPPLYVSCEHQSMHNVPTEERIGMWESPKLHSIEITTYLATLGTGDLN